MEDLIARRIRALFGRASAIVGQRLLSHRLSCVRRITLAPSPGTPDSVIAKYLPRKHFRPGLVAVQPEFVEEQVTHRFLRSLDAERDFKPALLDFDACGLTVMADLGANGHPVPRTFQYLIPRLASAFATLHGRTHGREALYLELRRDGGLADDEDGRVHGATVIARRARAGLDWLLSAPADVTRVSTIAALDQEWTDVLRRVECGGEQRCLIHSDMANARQTFEVGDKLYFLDFEYARFGTPALDLCKPMLGKFETDMVTREKVWACPGFPILLAEAHRDAMARHFGATQTNADWRRELAAALIYTALTLLGQIILVEGLQLRGGNLGVAYGVLSRLGLLLETLMEYPHTRRFLAPTSLAGLRRAFANDFPWPRGTSAGVPHDQLTSGNNGSTDRI